MTIAYYAPQTEPGRIYGLSIDSITANGSTLGAATVIVAPSAWTIVNVAVTQSPLNHAVALPTGAQIGDVVEIYAPPVSGVTSFFIFAPSGETFTDGTSVITVAPSGISAIVRKIDTSLWGIMAVFA